MALLTNLRILTRNAGNLTRVTSSFVKNTTLSSQQTSQKLIHALATYSLPTCTVQHPNQIVYRYSTKNKLSDEEIKTRVMKVVAAYDKVSADKLSLDSHFINDLGLDSLDHVEVIMAMEDEFGFEIPDMDAEKLMKPSDIIRYVGDREDVYE